MSRFAMFATTGLLAVAPLAAQPAPPAAQFVAKAGASDLYEKASSQLVLKDAKDAKVRDYANMMIMDHGKTTRQVTAAAKADGLTPKPPKLDAKQAKLIAELKAASPAARETVYLKQQVASHEEALALMTAYSEGGDKPALKQAATGAVPIVKTHLDQVRTLAASR